MNTRQTCRQSGSLILPLRPHAIPLEQPAQPDCSRIVNASPFEVMPAQCPPVAFGDAQLEILGGEAHGISLAFPGIRTLSASRIRIAT